MMSRNIKNEKLPFLNHLQPFIKRTPNISSGPLSQKLYYFNQRIHHSDEPWSSRKNDFVTGVHLWDAKFADVHHGTISQTLKNHFLPATSS